MKPAFCLLMFAVLGCKSDEPAPRPVDASYALPPREPGQTLTQYCNNPGALTYSYAKTPETPTPLARNLAEKHGIQVLKGPPDRKGNHVMCFTSSEDGRRAHVLLLQNDYAGFTVAKAVKRWCKCREWKKYVDFVVGRACVSRKTLIGDLSDTELRRVAIAQSEWEGGPRVAGPLCQN